MTTIAYTMMQRLLHRPRLSTEINKLQELHGDLEHLSTVVIKELASLQMIVEKARGSSDPEVVRAALDTTHDVIQKLIGNPPSTTEAG